MTKTVPSYGVPFGEVVREAFGNLRARGQRSSLALLGIVIGTASIMAMLNIGHIAQLETMKQFSKLGVDMIQVSATGTGAGIPGFDRALVEGLPRTDPDVIEATPFSVGHIKAQVGAREAPVRVIAATPRLNTVMGLSLSEGRLLSEIDDCALVAVIGARAAEELTPGTKPPIGRQVAIGSYLFTIVGILQPAANEALSSANYNDAVIIPFGCARRVMPSADASDALVRVSGEADVDRVDARLRISLANQRTAIQTRNAKAIIATMNRQKALIAGVLAAIGGISLLVGGIGVMNVMLMNVMERRREIGLRAAIGATPRDIQIMFLLEAGMLAAAGGLAGSLIGLAIAALTAKLLGWTFAVAYTLLPVGPGGAGVIGTLFGLYPALSASRVNPIEALRAD